MHITFNENHMHISAYSAAMCWLNYHSTFVTGNTYKQERIGAASTRSGPTSVPGILRHLLSTPHTDTSSIYQYWHHILEEPWVRWLQCVSLSPPPWWLSLAFICSIPSRFNTYKHLLIFATAHMFSEHGWRSSGDKEKQQSLQWSPCRQCLHQPTHVSPLACFYTAGGDYKPFAILNLPQCLDVAA